MARRKSLLALATILGAFGFTEIAASGELPGTVPKINGAPRASKDPKGLRTGLGLKVFYEKFGKYRLSVDAAGSNGASHTVLVKKPAADATVEKAYLLASSNYTNTITSADVTLDGTPVSWFSSVYNDIPPDYPSFFNSVLGDVTSLVKPKVDAAAVGDVSFTVGEPTTLNANIDGEILVVVFNSPSAPTKRTISLLFGAQQIDGDQFNLSLAAPIDPSKPGARLDFGLGTSFSFCTLQYSVIKVNGQPLSSSSGCEDDGGSFDGGLITAGGLGDSRANPPNPNSTPLSIRYDDELYNLLPFITKTTTALRIDTVNPSRDDNIFFAFFDTTANADVNKDTDGDGLLDEWETSGYDHDGDDVVDVPIHQRGANPQHKDLFIQYAWMNAGAGETKSHRPSAAVLDAVTAAFARAPVSNPDGINGITVHWRSLGGVAHDSDLNPPWTDFDAIMNPLVTDAERKIYRRMLNGHGYSGGSSSGLARDLPGSDFIETLGNWSSNPGTFKQRAGTIMHELGHTLGLRHGGVDHENYKPNHLSVMSYANQMSWLLRNEQAYLDYERFDLNDLDESALSEPAGLSLPGPDTPLARYGVRWFSGGVQKVKTKNSGANVDWNANRNATNNPVAVDLNNSGGNSVLRAGYPEWSNIIYDGGEIGPGRARDKNTMTYSDNDLVELTYEEYVRMEKSRAAPK